VKVGAGGIRAVVYCRPRWAEAGSWHNYNILTRLGWRMTGEGLEGLCFLLLRLTLDNRLARL
jgi:hypothetical protein